MYFCYIDESGLPDLFPINHTPPHTPVFVLCGVIFEAGLLQLITSEFLDLKSNFFPHTQSPRPLDRILSEIKGSDLRSNYRTKGRRVRRHTIGFLDNLLKIIEKYDGKIIGRVLIKNPGNVIDRRNVYTSYVQHLCKYLNMFLDGTNSHGLIIADSRVKPDNAIVAHSIFTQKFGYGDDAYPHILELPVFSHSDNHAGIQIADILCSALIFPIAAYAYCTGHITGSPHVNPRFEDFRNTFGQRLKKLQYRFTDNTGTRRGGITVCDNISGRHGGYLFHG